MIWLKRKNLLLLQSQNALCPDGRGAVATSWPIRLSVRTRDFHSLKSSSTLLGTTNINKEYKNKT